MGESVSFTVFLKDLATKPLVEFGKTGEKTFGKLRDAQGRFIAGQKQSGSAIAKMSGGFGSLAGLAGRAFAGVAAFATIESIGKLAIDAEQTGIAFETMLGSAEKGQRAIKDLKDFSAATPFESDEVIQAGRSMLAFGFKVEELKPNLTALGNVASGLNIPFGELATIFGKAKVAGTVMSEDLNELAGRGVPIFTELAKVMGKPAGQIKKLASEGKIHFEDIQTAFNNMSGAGGQFFNLMQKQSTTTGGRLSTLKDDVLSVGLEIGTSLLPAMNAGIDALNRFVAITRTGIGWIRQHKEAVKAVGVAIGFGATAWGLYTLATSASTIATNIFTGAQWLLNAALTANPFGIAIAGLAAIAGGLYYAWQKSEAFRGSILGLWEASKTVFRNIAQSALTYLGGLGDLLKGIVTMDTDLIKAGFGKTVNGLKGFYLEAGKGAADAFYKGYESGKSPGEKLSLAAANPSWLQNPGGAGSGAAGSGAGKGSSSARARIAGVQGDARAAKNFTVHIQSIVSGGLNISTTTIKESAIAIENAVREVLVKAVRDVEILGG